MDSAEWIAAEHDRGGVRLWRMRGADAAHRIDYSGTSALADALARDADLPLVLSDLTGQYVPPDAQTVPVTARLRLVEVEIETRRCHLVPSLKHQSADLYLHGQLARLVGVLAAAPAFEGVICMPGMRSTWVWVSAGEICHFQTYPSGQILQALDADAAVMLPAKGFGRAVEDAVSRPQRAYGKWLSAQGSDLCGHVVGLELADAKPYWLGQSVTLLAKGAMSQLYADALRQLGVEVVAADAEAALLAGLYHGYISAD